MAKLICLMLASLDDHVEDEQGKFGWAAPDEEVHTFVSDLARPLARLYARGKGAATAYGSGIDCVVLSSRSAIARSGSITSAGSSEPEYGAFSEDVVLEAGHFVRRWSGVEEPESLASASFLHRMEAGTGSDPGRAVNTLPNRSVASTTMSRVPANTGA